MTLSTGPNLGVLVNGALGEEHYSMLMQQWRALDALVQPRVIDKDLNAPPSSPTDGASYIVGPAPTGAWAGHIGHIARWSLVANAWEFFVPKDGWSTWVGDENVRYERKSGLWVVVETGSGGGSSPGVVPERVNVSLSDMNTDVTVGTGKAFWIAPSDGLLSDFFVGLGVAPSSSGVVTVDVKKNGTTMLATLPNIEATESTSLTGVAAVIGTPSFQRGDILTFDVVAAGTGAKGLQAVLMINGSGATGGSDMLSPLLLPELAVNGATTLTTGRMHVCSGTTADYTVNLPAAASNAGKLVAVRMSQSLTRWVTVAGNASELIDGRNTRKMWAGESATLLCDGTGWIKVGGRTRPLRAVMVRATADGSFALPSLAWTGLPTPTIVQDNTSVLAVPQADTSAGCVRVLRDGVYTVAAFAGFGGLPTGGSMAAGPFYQMPSQADFNPSDSPNAWGFGVADSAGFMHVTGAASFDAVAGGRFAITAFNNDSVSRNTRSGSTVNPSLSVIEIPTW